MLGHSSILVHLRAQRYWWYTHSGVWESAWDCVQWKKQCTQCQPWEDCSHETQPQGVMGVSALSRPGSCSHSQSVFDLMLHLRQSVRSNIFRWKEHMSKGDWCPHTQWRTGQENISYPSWWCTIGWWGLWERCSEQCAFLYLFWQKCESHIDSSTSSGNYMLCMDS